MTAQDMRTVASQAQRASRNVGALASDVKNAVLTSLASALDDSHQRIIDANKVDLQNARDTGLSCAKLRRLTLNEAGVSQMTEGLAQIAAMPDPVGAVTLERVAPSGLRIQKVRAPLGVVAMIYEARPSVTIDAFALCFKAGNACILKGGKEATRSNETLADLAREALIKHGAPADTVQLVTTSDRDKIRDLLGCEGLIDLVIPRGGESLIRFVHEHSRIPMVQHFHGVCHIYVDESADVDRAVDVCATAKTSAPATCNAVECVLVHERVAAAFLPALAARLSREGVTMLGDAAACALAPTAKQARDDDWGREFLDLTLAVRVVLGLNEAIAHIERYGSNHTEAILTSNDAASLEFTRRVQSSCVLVNASTRFNDGFQLGLGAEIGISTSKIHAYGPMGLEELTTQRWIAKGDWLTR